MDLREWQRSWATVGFAPQRQTGQGESALADGIDTTAASGYTTRQMEYKTPKGREQSVSRPFWFGADGVKWAA